MTIFQSRRSTRVMLSLILSALLLGGLIGGMVNLTAGSANAAPPDLAPGQTMNVQLSAAGQPFERWSAHPETSACSGGEGRESGEGGEGHSDEEVAAQ